MIQTQDSYAFLQTLPDFDLDIIYADPPYALGSEVIIRKDGKVDYAKASDFMGKWEMPTGDYWEKWFKEAYRTLKHGGYCVMFGMDRQLLLFKYYAHLAGFEEQQSLYWYFISNFPKATGLSKMIDKTLGVEFEVAKPVSENVAMSGANYERLDKQEPTTNLAKKYDGYKYSISPLKQTNETIMVFRKPTKTGSVLHDCLAYENGDKTITVGALNIDGNRVGTDTINIHNAPTGTFAGGEPNRRSDTESYREQNGRYPAQTFIDEQTAEVLDRQSDNYAMSEDYEGGCSKILHKCKYEQEDYDLYNYEPKVNGGERNAGCDGFEQKAKAEGNSTMAHNPNDIRCTTCGKRPNTVGNEKNCCSCEEPIYDWYKQKNNHPTLKPIALNERVLKLFKTPNDQKICYPFAGSGSEIIGGIKAGFDNWVGCEINQEYVDIANARIEYWRNEMSTQTTIFDFL
jgi:DNA modification methylase